MKTLIIIPAYNEALNIEKVVDDLIECCPQCDYIVVNDCSSDTTREVLALNNIKHIDLPINLGIGGCVQTGYQYAAQNNYDIAIQMDGDGQHNARYITELIKPIIDGYADVVIGSRFIDKQGFQSSVMRRFGINFLSSLIKICSSACVKDVTSGFRAINRDFIALFAGEYAHDYPEPEAIVAAAFHNARIVEIPVIMNQRIAGTSSITLLKSVYYMIKVSLSIFVYSLSLKKKERQKK